MGLIGSQFGSKNILIYLAIRGDGAVRGPSPAGRPKGSFIGKAEAKKILMGEEDTRCINGLLPVGLLHPPWAL